MSMIIVLLIGAGTLFISSSLDNTPIATTFQKIISGQTINWSGSSSGFAGVQPKYSGGVQQGNCSFPANASLTQIEDFCACMNGLPKGNPLNTNNAAYRACMQQYGQ